MPVQHLPYDFGKPYGSLLRNCITSLETGLDGLNDLIQTMVLMLNGDGSDPTHFDYMVTKFGFAAANGIAANQVAKSSYEELLSLQAKLMTDASVTNVRAALFQAFGKFR